MLLSNFFIIFVRTGAIVFFLPGFGENYVSSRIKIVISFYLSILIFPIIPLILQEGPSSNSDFFKLLVSEASIGVFWGAMIRMIIFCLQISGAIMSQATSLAQIFGGTASMDAQPAISHILVISGIALLSIIGLHGTYLSYIINTYSISPPGEFLTGMDIAIHSSSTIAKTFATAFQISAALLTTTLLYNIILGVINRAMPQLLVSFVGAPAITAGGLMFLFIMGPALMDIWLNFSEKIIKFPEEL